MLASNRTLSIFFTYHIFAIDGFPFGRVIGVKFCVFACQSKQHCSLQIHPQFGVQVLLWRLSGIGRWESDEALSPRSSRNLSTYLEDIKVKAECGVDEVQSAWRDCDGEFVIKDLAVELSLEQLRFPGLLQTI